MSYNYNLITVFLYTLTRPERSELMGDIVDYLGYAPKNFPSTWNSIQRIIRCETKQPREKTLIKIFSAMDLSVDFSSTLKIESIPEGSRAKVIFDCLFYPPMKTPEEEIDEAVQAFTDDFPNIEENETTVMVIAHESRRGYPTVTGSKYHTAEECSNISTNTYPNGFVRKRGVVDVLREYALMFNMTKCSRCERIEISKNHSGLILTKIDVENNRVRILLDGHSIWLNMYHELTEEPNGTFSQSKVPEEIFETLGMLDD